MKFRVRSRPADIARVENLVARLETLPVQAVGERTAAAARQAGLGVAAADAGDAGRLAAQIIAGNAPCRVLYLCGRVRRPDFESLLSQAGFAVEAVEIYDTRAIEPSDDDIDQAIGGNPLWGAVVYSPGGAGRLSALVARARMAALFDETRFFCLSASIAAALGDGLVARSIVAREPREAALVERMKRA